MKKFRRGLLICLFVALAAFCTFFAACGSKATLSFETNGGTAIESVEVQKGEEYTLPVPTREGYGFDGWFLTEDFSGNPVTSAVAESDCTFYAKWQKLYRVTLELGGGTLGVSSVYLKAGDNLLSALEGYVPTLADHEFGGWFRGANEISKNSIMGEEDITVTARYKVLYTVKMYLQNLAGNGYEPAEEDYRGYEYAGGMFTPDYAPTGFERVTHEGELVSKELSETASENVFTIYYDRIEFNALLLSNYPDGSAEQSATVSCIYGNELTLPDTMPFDAPEHYVLVGWSTRSNGAVEYASNFLEAASKNADTPDPVTIAIDRDMVLYAVWCEAYLDIFGGIDEIYYPDETSGVIYLCRDGDYYKGGVNSARREFFFDNEAGQELMIGKLYSGHVYAYENELRASRTYFELIGSNLYTARRLTLDAYNGFTYTVVNEDTTTITKEGIYTIEDGVYLGVCEDGTTVSFVVGTVSTNAGNFYAFMVRNDEDIALGTMNRVGVNASGQLVSYQITLTLNGFGVATYTQGTSSSTYSYTRSGDLINLTSAGVSFKLVDTARGKGFALFTPSLQTTFTGENGATLTLDGAYLATYKSGTRSSDGYYTVSNSYFGGYIVRFWDTNGNAYTFRTSGTSFVQKNAGYAEYYYTDGSTIWYSALYVFDDDAENTISVYSMQEVDGATTRHYVKVLEGTRLYNAANEAYTFQKTALCDLEGVVLSEGAFDLTKLQTIVFSLGTISVSGGSYNAIFPRSISLEGEETTEYDEQYTERNGSGTLTLVSGFAIYRPDAEHVFIGLYSEARVGVNTITFTAGTSSVYLELHDEDKTYIALVGLIGTAASVSDSGTANRNETLTFDGKGGASYTVANPDDPENPTVTEGTVAESEETTAFGNPIYVFTQTGEGGMTFRYVLLQSGSTVYFSKLREAYEGEFTVEGGGTLTLDGYLFRASYTDANSQTVTGIYILDGEDVIRFTAASTSENFYFDITNLENKEVTVRGEEYADYLLFDNWYFDETYLSFDGYGALTAYTFERVEGKLQRKDLGEGTYTRQEDGDYYVWFMKDTTEVKLTGTLGYYVSGSTVYHAFHVVHRVETTRLVSTDDWTILELDEHGRATRIGLRGGMETGQYVLITDNLLYYVNDAGTDASVYSYSSAAGTITQKVFTPTGYFTSDLESLLFSEYGFMMFNGVTRYYYDIDRMSGAVKIYLQREIGTEGANKYGFVEETFGEEGFEDVKEFEGKTYYRNDGYAVTFTREADTKDNYPIPVSNNGALAHVAIEDMTFMPSGDGEFTVSASIRYRLEEGGNPVTTTAYVVRTRNEAEDGTVTFDTYILYEGFYRFDIEVEYTGMGHASFRVVGMSYVIPDMYSNTYVQMYIFLAQLLGIPLPNSYGLLTYTEDYGVDGTTVTDSYLDGWFGEGMGLYDTAGTLIETVDHFAAERTSSGITAEFTGEDGVSYRLHLSPSVNSTLGVYTYALLAFTRVQTFEKNGITVEVERTIATELSTLAAGDLYSVALRRGEEPILIFSGSITANSATLLSVTKSETPDADGNPVVESAKYYTVTAIADTHEDIGGGEEEGGGSSGEEGEERPPVVEEFTDVTLTEQDVSVAYAYTRTTDSNNNTVKTLTMTVYYLADTHEILLLEDASGARYRVTSCDYDAETGTYTVVTSDSRTRTVTISDSEATIS